MNRSESHEQINPEQTVINRSELFRTIGFEPSRMMQICPTGTKGRHIPGRGVAHDTQKVMTTTGIEPATSREAVRGIEPVNFRVAVGMLTCFHYIHIEKNCPPTCGHVLSPIWTIFELVRDINKTNVLTNFHDDWAKIVTSRVKTAPPPGSHKNAPPSCGHGFSPIWTIFRTRLRYQ
ncbi:hypothetical protein DPMN_063530 [Dreissena polymorpha]|uniref:Uncharacterized protein n=1 Tax=Dreissena polymorpha TaxID=45954 RepID=A0A9D4CBV6_DREPO|nr:hypothetical protein DPMN_063530 [Dreissena polymorpha]